MKEILAVRDGYQIPDWIKVFSCVFLIFLAMPLCLVSYLLWHQNLYMRAFGFNVHAQENLPLYVLLVVLPFCGGIAAVGLLRRKVWGLIVGAAFAVVAIGTCCASFFIVLSDSDIYDHGAIIELGLLVLFLRWIIKTSRGSSASVTQLGITPAGEVGG